MFPHFCGNAASLHLSLTELADVSLCGWSGCSVIHDDLVFFAAMSSHTHHTLRGWGLERGWGWFMNTFTQLFFLVLLFPAVGFGCTLFSFHSWERVDHMFGRNASDFKLSRRFCDANILWRWREALMRSLQISEGKTRGREKDQDDSRSLQEGWCIEHKQ